MGNNKIMNYTLFLIVIFLNFSFLAQYDPKIQSEIDSLKNELNKLNIQY